MLPVQKKNFSTMSASSSSDVNNEGLTPEEAHIKSILKQKRVLRRYLRLKRNNFAKNHEATLTDSFYVQHFLPKFEQILSDNKEFLETITKDEKNESKPIEISSYNPIAYEMNITPVIAKLLENSNYNLRHSLPIVTNKDEPLVFREYRWGDDLVKSHLFSVYEPRDDKKQVFPQVMIVPLMGFMEDCHRIGYGGGFYDRTIEQLREMYDNKILMIGVCFEAQKFDRFGAQPDSAPVDDIWNENANSKIAKMRAKFANKSTISWVQLDTDEPLDYIVTERRIYKKE